MQWVGYVCQTVAALAIANVWLLRFNRRTDWRGGRARNMREEFAVYGLPRWSVEVVGGLKLLFALLLLVGLWVPVVATLAAAGLAVLMVGALVMHINVRDPLRKSAPALGLLLLCVVIMAT